MASTYADPDQGGGVSVAVMPRFKRGIQYAAAFGSSTNVSGLLDRPVKPGDDM